MHYAIYMSAYGQLHIAKLVHFAMQLTWSCMS